MAGVKWDKQVTLVKTQYRLVLTTSLYNAIRFYDTRKPNTLKEKLFALPGISGVVYQQASILLYIEDHRDNATNWSTISETINRHIEVQYELRNTK